MLQKKVIGLVSLFFLGMLLPGYGDTFFVEETFNSKPFAYELKELEQRDLHTVFAITYPSPIKTELDSNNIVHGELYLPRDLPTGIACPGVLINHILAGGFNLERMMCTSLANTGVAAMFIMLPYYGERGGQKKRRQMLENAECFITSLEQAVLDNRRAIDILTSRTEIAADRIGIGGGSLGAIMSATVCGFEPRVERAFLLLGGGNLEKIFRHPSGETRPFREFLDKQSAEDRTATLSELKRLDPVSQTDGLQRLSKAGKLKMICAAEDQVIPPDCSRELAQAANCDILWLPGVNHYTIASQSAFVFAELVDFFSTNPPLQWHPSVKDTSVDLQTKGLRLLAGFFRDMSLFLTGIPAEGQAHHLGLKLALAINGSNQQSELQLSRGSKGWYKLYAKVPKLGQGWMGQNQFPWLAGADQSLFVGSLNALDDQHCSTFISPEQLMKFQMLSGILASGAMAPEMLKTYATLSVTAEDQDKIRVLVDIKYAKFKGRLHLLFNDKDTAESGFFNSSKGNASFVVTDWRLNAPTPAAFFATPEDRQIKAVNQEDVLRMTAAVYEHLLESQN
ncbi:MAG: hypothetical protein WCT05_10795 [Lentisphaeria bacterium]